MPVDPLTNGGNPSVGGTGYMYWSGADGQCAGGEYYWMAALLENTSDKDRIGVTDPTYYCSGSATDKFVGSRGWNANVFLITSQ